MATGARIQVRRNIDKADGIVNGACGSLVAFRDKDAHGIPGLSILFDNKHVGAIQRRMTGEKNVTYVDPKDVTYTGTDGRTITRWQLPVVLAWTTSIHKSQGKTFDSIAANLRTVFSGRDAGMAYVALLRCRTAQPHDFNR